MLYRAFFLSFALAHYTLSHTLNHQAKCAHLPRVFFCLSVCATFSATRTAFLRPFARLFYAICPAKCARLRLATLSATRHTVFCVSFAFCGLNFAQILKNIFEILKFKDF